MSISILVPIYNVEKYIERCARSLFEQTYPDIEYIFVNDCTPDNSFSILKNVIQDYPNRKEHIRIITHEKNQGLAAARNTAVENCQTNFLMHVDSDDYIEKDAVEKLVAEQQKGNFDIVTGNALIHRIDNKVVLRQDEPKEKKQLVRFYAGIVLNHTIWGRLIRTSLYKDNNIKTLEGCNIGEDHQVIPRLFYFANTFSSINDIIYHYDCTNENSYTSQNRNARKNLLQKYQNTKSLNVLKLFFEDKEDYYLDQIYASLPPQLNLALYASTVQKQKKIHDDLAIIFNGLDKNQLKKHGYIYSKKKIFFINNYYFDRLKYILSHYYHLLFKQ